MLTKEFAAPGEPRVSTTGRASVRLAGLQPLGLATLIAYDVTPPDQPRGASWAARIAGYAFEIRAADNRMALAFHWHPTGRSPITWPHLHLGSPIANIDLSKAHVPTGMVTLQDVLRFAIVDLGVRPLRDDWYEVLTQSLDDPQN